MKVEVYIGQGLKNRAYIKRTSEHIKVYIDDHKVFDSEVDSVTGMEK